MAVIADPRLRPRARARRRARTRRLPTGLRHRIYLTRVSFFSLGGSGKHYTGPERAASALGPPRPPLIYLRETNTTRTGHLA